MLPLMTKFARSLLTPDAVKRHEPTIREFIRSLSDDEKHALHMLMMIHDSECAK